MEHEALYRLAIFLGLFALIAGLEHVFPRRTLRPGKARRWLTNWSLVLLSTLGLRLLALGLPLLAVGAALDAAAQGWGLFNHLRWPGWIEVLLAVLLFDLLLWLQHLVTHKVPLLWRLHRVHHADVDFDISTAIRFHPVEIALSMLLKIGAVYVLGPSGLAVVIFEVLLNGTALFTHANLRLPGAVDAMLRRVLVTPDMHRVHHSVHRSEHDRNYGFALSLWDRLFGTYLAQPRHGHDGMTVGLRWQDDAPTRLGWSLWLPFRR
jgi:sterol desaturase/sphingolipid hydroxylase (fatty acid hydroxylase superfamily)